MNIPLPARPPFNLRSVIRSHGWFQLAPFAEDEASGSLRYVDELPSGRVVDYCIQQASAGVQVEVDATMDLAEQAAVSLRAAWMLGLDQDFSTFYTLAQDEPKLRRAVERAAGRILRSSTLFEDILKTILTTNTLWAATKRMDRNLVDQFGAPLSANPARRAFPTPARLAATDEATLRSSTRLGYRAPYVLELARRVASGELDVEAWKGSGLPTPELRKQLMRVKGVGGYAAANLLMLLGHYDFIPVDSWALKMVSQEWHGGAPVGPAEVEAAFARWGEWKGLAYWLWDWSQPG